MGLKEKLVIITSAEGERGVIGVLDRLHPDSEGLPNLTPETKTIKSIV